MSEDTRPVRSDSGALFQVETSMIEASTGEPGPFRRPAAASLGALRNAGVALSPPARASTETVRLHRRMRVAVGLLLFVGLSIFVYSKFGVVVHSRTMAS